MMFADATENFDDADFIIIGIPYEDEKMSFRSGTSKAPDYIREVSDNYESYDIFSGVDLKEVSIHDAGNFGIKDGKEIVEKSMKEGKIPLIIGGSHSITPFIIPYEYIDGVVILDAHADFRNSYLNNMKSHACTSRRIFEKIGKNGIVSIGIRSISMEEYEDARKLGFRYYKSTEFNIDIANEINYDKIYMSIDMDVFDPCHASGVSNPEPMGLGYEIFDFINKMASRIVAMDIVEVCPPYDDGRASLLAAKIIRDFIAWKSKLADSRKDFASL